MAINCFRFFYFTSFDDVDKLTIAQYELLMKSVKRRMVDQEYHEHRQAFLNFSVQSQRKSGKGKTKPIYSTFDKFYNYEKRMREAEGGFKPKSRIFNAIVSAKKGREKDG